MKHIFPHKSDTVVYGVIYKHQITNLSEKTDTCKSHYTVNDNVHVHQRPAKYIPIGHFFIMNSVPAI